ncbi:unnamed protein product [Phyllotreta striolata]|uniref:Uncharacterized protein n=1 Tax=Phyllotreta striolata TaxID=444603 RepID=A0A9N9TAR9_PHYSR|nr:unnamed protein product [Phyllotreta striolata]
MKIYIFLLATVFAVVVSGVFVPPRPGHKKQHLLGSELCTRGPGYWCQNLTSAADCHATKHCIQTVWMHKKLEPDDSSVCQICLEMVKEARDQLESNETQELIKEVFETECSYFRIKPIVKECDKIADNYIPDLIDTLASQMNPQLVCSVAGLCNNEKIHQMIEASDEVPQVKVASNTCQGCHTVVNILEDRFAKMTKDDLLHRFLQFCGKLSSFSDGCSNIIITYFEEIYRHLQAHLNANEVCLMSGECSAQFHEHRARIEITPNSHIGYVSVGNKKDDLPCALCEQLVNHLKNLLVANTTEIEFKQVLEGLCKQTGQFSGECTELVDQYYEEVYNFLTTHLNSTEVCEEIGICSVTEHQESFIAPLLPADGESAKKAIEISNSQAKPLVHIKLSSDVSNTRVYPAIIAEQQLPIDTMMPHTELLYNKQVCEFCEYFLHYVQNAITDPKTEEKIAEVIDEACDKLPTSVNETCVDFVNSYAPALIAILAQEVDPSVVCPLIKACPSSDSHNVEVFMQAKSDSKCPLCLIAVTKLEDLIKNNNTEEQIQEALKKVCSTLPQTLDNECDDFVTTYTKQLVEMLIDDFKPEEVCVALKLCTDSRPASKLPPYVFRHVEGNIETNVIPDNTINGQIIGKNLDGTVQEKPQCVLCEFVMKEIEDELKDKKTADEIENAVKNICKIMPSSIRKECDDFIDKNGNMIIQLLIAALEPSEICTMMKLCGNNLETIRVEISECPICEMAADNMIRILTNPKVDHNVMHVIEKTCRGLLPQYREKCTNIVETNGDEMLTMAFDHSDKRTICRKLGYCKSLMADVFMN